MTTITIPLTLPDGLAARAKAKGLLSSAAIEAYLHERLREDESYEQLPEGFDHRLKGLVDPVLYRRGEIYGDIVTSIGEKWESDS